MKLCETGEHDFRQDPETEILWCKKCAFIYDPYTEEGLIDKRIARIEKILAILINNSLNLKEYDLDQLHAFKDEFL